MKEFIKKHKRLYERFRALGTMAVDAAWDGMITALLTHDPKRSSLFHHTKRYAFFKVNDYWRRQRRLSEFNDCFTTSMDDKLEQKERIAVVHEAIKTLNEPLRTTAEYVFIHGVAQNKLARILKITPQAVSLHVERIIKTLSKNKAVGELR